MIVFLWLEDKLTKNANSTIKQKKAPKQMQSRKQEKDQIVSMGMEVLTGTFSFRFP